MTSSKQDPPGRRQPGRTGSAEAPRTETEAPSGGQYDAGHSQSGVQGEGNYEAAREYDDAQREFVESGRVERAAREAAPRSNDEAQQMEQAEREGKSHSKGEDEDDEMKR